MKKILKMFKIARKQIWSQVIDFLFNSEEKKKNKISINFEILEINLWKGYNNKQFIYILNNWKNWKHFNMNFENLIPEK